MSSFSASPQNRILIATDAWMPQTNGVVTTLVSLKRELQWAGYDVSVITPNDFLRAPSWYPGVNLALPFGFPKKFDALRPNRVLIATEGPIGLAARAYCNKRHIPFVTMYTTRWPEYFEAQLGWPPRAMTYRWLQWFHRHSQALLVSTPSFMGELLQRGFQNISLLPRGVDTHRFHPIDPDEKARFLPQLPRPLFLYVGRVSKEKNLGAFLGLDLPGTKVIVGLGPDEEALKSKYPQAVFLGAKHGTELSHVYACCDVFVFPSKTDTFGLVMLEALASGLPVAAYNVTGPKDIFSLDHETGFLSEDFTENGLQQMAILAWKALEEGRLSPDQCLKTAQRFSWQSVIERLLAVTPVFEWS
ncbi:MAG: glycosyltransferase family 1 protein [Vampirovibrionales bacterium]|nr:glycosyltransferase family 1 protein [Vampirovibrionales bacterium]